MNLFGTGLFEIGGLLFLAILVVAGAVWLINSRYLSVRFKTARANLGQAASEHEAANAVNLMKQGIQDCTDQVHKAKSGLVKVQGSIGGLERQVKTGTVEEARLTSRIQAAINEGKSNDDPILKQLGVSLKRVREDLKNNREQLEAQHGIYNDLLSQISAAQRRAEALEQEANSLGAQLETSKLTAELADFANNFDAKGIASGLDGVAKYREMVRRGIDENNAKMKVNRDLNGNTADLQTWEDEQDATDVLNELRNKSDTGK